MRRGSICLALLIVIILSITTLSAQTDISGSLKNWYAQTFQQKSSEHSNEIAKKITSMEESIRSFFNQTSKEIDNAFDDFLNTSTARSKEEIQSHQEQYENQLHETKSQLLLELNDGELTDSEREKIEEDMEKIATEILRDILSKQK